MSVGTVLAQASVEIRADTSQFDKDVAKMKQTSMSTGQEITKMFAQVFGAALFIGGMKKSIAAASDLNETVTKTEVIFGDAADEMNRMGDQAAQSMGMSKKAYLDAASGLKGLLDNMGLASEDSTKWSQDMTALGGDLASFFNTQPADAIYAISAALRGESEPIRRYNVQISDATLKLKAMELGLYDGKGALDVNAKAQASLAVIMDQTTAAQGDFERTSDGLANTQRKTTAETENAAASLGQTYLPVMQRVTAITGTLATVFGGLPAPVQTAVVALLGLVALSGPIGRSVEAVHSLTAAIRGLSTTTKVSLGVIGLLLSAAGLLYSIFSGGEGDTMAVAAATDALAESLKASTAELIANIAAVQGLKGELPDTTAGFTALSSAVVDALNAETAGQGDALVVALGKVDLTAQDAALAMMLLSDATRSGSASTIDFARDVLGLTDDQANWLRLVKTSTYEQELLALGMDEATATSKGLSREVYAQADAFKKVFLGTKDVRAAFKDSKVDINAMATGFIDGARGASGLTSELVAQAEAQATANGQTGNAVAIYLEYIRLTSGLSEEEQRLALDLNAAAAANAQLTAATEETTEAVDTAKLANERLKKSVEQVRGEMSDAADAADKLRTAIDEVFGASKDFESANRAVLDGTQKLTDHFMELDETGQRYAATLDINTQRGRENRAEVESQVDAILDFGVAMVGAGYSTEDAAANVAKMTEDLKAQLSMLGLTEEEIDTYLTTLGLTPENVTTTIELANDNIAKARLEELIGQLGEIDEGAAAEIDALIAEGLFDEAETKLQQLARERDVVLNVVVQGRWPVGLGAAVNANALGGYKDKPEIGLYGEAGPEAILPLTNPSRLQELLGDPRIGGPVAAAMAQGAAGGEGGGSSAGSGGTGTLQVVNHIYGAQRQYVQELMRQMDIIRAGG